MGSVIYLGGRGVIKPLIVSVIGETNTKCQIKTPGHCVRSIFLHEKHLKQGQSRAYPISLWDDSY